MFTVFDFLSYDLLQGWDGQKIKDNGGHEIP